MMRKVEAAALTLLTVTAAIGLTACGKSAAHAAVTSAADIPTVPVAKVATEDLSHQVVLTAEFTPFQDVDVMAKVAGYIKKINVDVGDHVSQGQLLATLEIPEMADDLSRAQAAVERAKADVQRAKDELTRAQSSHDIAHLSYTRLNSVAEQKPGLIAQQEIDDAHSKDLVAEAQVSSAKSALAAANEQVQVNSAEVQKVKTLFDYTRVTAPFAGVVTKRYADTGSMIQAGTASQTQAMPVVRLSENGLLRLILPVPESAAPAIRLGEQVEVHVPTLNRSFPGRVARFADKLDLSTRTMNTEVDVPNPNFVLIPGMYAEVNLTLQRHASVLAIPVTAVDIDSEAASQNGSSRASSGRVAIVMPNNHVQIRKVTLGLETATEVEVRSGLNEGDLVIIGGRSSLQPDEEVHPRITTLTASST